MQFPRILFITERFPPDISRLASSGDSPGGDSTAAWLIRSADELPYK